MVKYLEDGTRLITGYVPKMALTVIGLAVFAIIAAIFWLRLWRQGRRFMLTLCIGTTCMAIGFGARIPMTNDPSSIGIYIAQTMFILLSPCAFLANNYIILPRLATWLDAEDCLFLRSRRIVRIFVWSDVITFWLQAGGSGLTAAQSSSMQNIGKWITIVGLVAQLASFGLFCLLLVSFAIRLRSRTPWKWSNEMTTRTPNNTNLTIRFSFFEDWRNLFWALIFSCIGILIRCVFRLIEYAQGYDGTLRNTEVYFYVLDSLPLVFAIGVFCVFWPPVILTENVQPFATKNNIGEIGDPMVMQPLQSRQYDYNQSYDKV